MLGYFLKCSLTLGLTNKIRKLGEYNHYLEHAGSVRTDRMEINTYLPVSVSKEG